ncbi:MAG: hypothetical protein JO112_08750, partial [Planctomycetes bacterium]|nr:hypothetical protein [Planctomycetota bacterium]
MAERTPLYDAAQEAGASWVEEAGWLLPAHFGNAAEEYRQAREQAVVFDRSHHGKVEVAGKDAAQFLHNLCTNDVNHLAIGAGREAFLTTGQARIVAHVLLGHRRWPDGREVFWVDVGPGMGEKIFQHLDRHLISEQVELADRTRECAQLHPAGPAARAILERVLGGPMPDLAPLHHLEQSVGGAACLIRRHEPLGLPGFDL